MPGPEPAEGRELDAKTIQGQTTLQAAQNRMDSTQKALLATQESYVKANAALSEQQNKLTEIQANLKRLAASKITLVNFSDPLNNMCTDVKRLRSKRFSLNRSS